ncbi:PWWP domain-containing DNA repair factor 3A-like isoform X1 [Acipenser oxyrinchus oxyrinchus]|uniref:PWWP domain-containing DNA repair factor 3A-like isoform X1 n=1 Tax=Acipenser oxyrinchus oxyrinchus TaxID=40147 RepID=A0AAD8CJ16_ACIOX|nr:PWWP domain-containing DNA repair factor 3A-like isoform X1 [Acipenser oxyrinchus oxyrinchus]
MWKEFDRLDSQKRYSVPTQAGNPTYVLCLWEGRLWPAKLLQRAAVRSKTSKDNIEVEIFCKEKRVLINQADTAPLSRQNIEDISRQLDLDSNRQHVLNIFTNEDDSDEEFWGFLSESHTTDEKLEAIQPDPVKELLYRKALRLALNVLSENASCPSPISPGKKKRGRPKQQTGTGPLKPDCDIKTEGTPPALPPGGSGTLQHCEAVTPGKRGRPKKVKASNDSTTELKTPSSLKVERGIKRGRRCPPPLPPGGSGTLQHCEAVTPGKRGRPKKVKGSNDSTTELKTTSSLKEERGIPRDRCPPALPPGGSGILQHCEAVTPRKRGRPKKFKGPSDSTTELKTTSSLKEERGIARGRREPDSKDVAQTPPETLSPCAPRIKAISLKNQNSKRNCLLGSPLTDSGGIELERTPGFHPPIHSSTPDSLLRTDLGCSGIASPGKSPQGTPKRKVGRPPSRHLRKLSWECCGPKHLQSKCEQGQAPRRSRRRQETGLVSAAGLKGQRGGLEKDRGCVGVALEQPAVVNPRRWNRSCPDLAIDSERGQAWTLIPQALQKEAERTEEPPRSTVTFELPQFDLEENGRGSLSSDLSIEMSLLNESTLESSLQEDEEEEEEDELELPSFMKDREPCSITEGMCVWCKFKKYPFWPALVKSVNHKNKKASIIFVDDLLLDKNKFRKGMCVSLRTLKPFDCEEREQYITTARETYHRAIDWCVALIDDYSIRIACGSFSGSLAEYCVDDISYPVRREFLQGPSRMTFPSNLLMLEEDNLDCQTGGPHCRQAPSKKLLPDRSRAARDKANEKLVQYIVKARGVEKHLQAIIAGRKASRWLAEFLHRSRFLKWVDTYLEDDAQLEVLVNYLQSVCESVQNTQLSVELDRIRFILDVLLPEAVIGAIAAVDNISLEKAEEKYMKGPIFSEREIEEFNRQIEKEVKMKTRSLGVQQH